MFVHVFSFISIYLMQPYSAKYYNVTVEEYWKENAQCISEEENIHLSLEFVLVELQRITAEMNTMNSKFTRLDRRLKEFSRISTGVSDASFTDGRKRASAGQLTSETGKMPSSRENEELPINYPKDCRDVITQNPEVTSGIFFIQLKGFTQPVVIFCEFADGKAWNVFQRRLDGSVDFYRTWNDYKHGFGDVTGEFWLGNGKLHSLTHQGTYKLHIDMWDWNITHPDTLGNFYFAESQFFYIDNETLNYTLRIPDDFYAYKGFGGSGLRLHSGPFITHDLKYADNRENCARTFRTGWWFSTCVRNANLNGVYYRGGYANLISKERDVCDLYWRNIPRSLKKVVMKLARLD